MVACKEKEKCNFQYIVVEGAITGITRDQIIKILKAGNVLAGRCFYPSCHEMEPYRLCFPHSHLFSPEIEKQADRVLSLPMGTAVSIEEITRIFQIARFIVDHSREIHQSSSQFG